MLCLQCPLSKKATLNTKICVPLRVYFAIHLLSVNYTFPLLVVFEIFVYSQYTVKHKYCFSEMVLYDAFHTKYPKHLRKRNYYLVYQTTEIISGFHTGEGGGKGGNPP